MSSLSVNNVRLDFYLRKFISFLVYMLPIAIVTGPFLSDLFLSTCALYFLIISLKYKLWSYYQRYFVYIFSFFYFYILFLSLISENPLLSLESSLFYFRYLFFTLSIVYLIDHEKNFIKYIYYSTFFT